ncbi:MAG TPA: hypothetical protein VFS21_34250, partial [Roseiflexaceae bacterium]|nr:hypothetical protein [Roseiflexaceae bacterium]
MTLIVRRLAVWGALLGLLLAAVPTPPAHAAGSPPLRISEQAGGVLIAWDGPAASLSGWPTLRFGAVDLPARLITLRADGPVTVRLEQLGSVPWRGALAPAAPERPVLPAGLIPSAEPEQQDPPGAPVALVRQGRLRGVGVAVVAVTPVFVEAAGMRAVLRL